MPQFLPLILSQLYEQLLSPLHEPRQRSAAVLGNGLELWEPRGGGVGPTGCIISRIHCPGTRVLNHPQVVDKKI